MIDMRLAVPNRDRRFGSAPDYVPVLVRGKTGIMVPALFTVNQIDAAVERAIQNPEDAPKVTRTPAWRLWLENLFS